MKEGETRKGSAYCALCQAPACVEASSNTYANARMTAALTQRLAPVTPSQGQTGIATQHLPATTHMELTRPADTIQSKRWTRSESGRVRRSWPFSTSTRCPMQTAGMDQTPWDTVCLQRGLQVQYLPHPARLAYYFQRFGNPVLAWRNAKLQAAGDTTVSRSGRSIASVGRQQGFHRGTQFTVVPETHQRFSLGLHPPGRPERRHVSGSSGSSRRA